MRALEAAQLLDGARHGRRRVAHVQLHDLVALALACIAHRQRNVHRLARRRLRCRNAQIAVLEARVAQPIAELIQRLGAQFHVIALPMRPPARQLVAVEDRDLPRVARHRDRQLAAGIVIAKQHVRDRVRAFFAGQPRVQNRRDVRRDPRDRLRTPADQHHHDRRAGFGHRFHELLLHARQPEFGAVACFAAGAVVRQARFFAHNQDRHIRLPRRLDRFREALGRFAQHRLDARRIPHLRLRPQLGADAVQHADHFHKVGDHFQPVRTRQPQRIIVIRFEQALDVRRVRVVPDHVAHRVRVGADHRHRRDLLVQRQQAVLVLQQHDRFARDLPRQRALIGGIEHLRRAFDFHERILEQAQLELDAQHAADHLVQQRHIDRAPLHFADQRVAVAVRARQFDVDARLDRRACGIFLAGRHAVIGCQLIHREIVGHHQPVEAPFLAQNAGQQRTVRAARHAVQFVVAVHNRGESGGFDRRFERAQVDLAHLARGDVRRGPVHAALAHAVAHEVLARRHDALAPVVALKPLHVGRSHPRDEVRIFAQRLLDASPAWIARDVEHGGQRVMRAHGPHLRLDHRGHFFHEFGIPRARHADRLRKARRAQRHIAAAAFLVHHRRNAQPRVVDQPLLDRVRQSGAVRRAQVARPANTRNLADAMRHQPSGFPLREGQAVQKLEYPCAAQLSHLFFERHLRQQIADALLGGPGRIFIKWLLGCCLRHRRNLISGSCQKIPESPDIRLPEAAARFSSGNAVPRSFPRAPLPQYAESGRAASIRLTSAHPPSYRAALSPAPQCKSAPAAAPKASARTESREYSSNTAPDIPRSPAAAVGSWAT